MDTMIYRNSLTPLLVYKQVNMNQFQIRSLKRVASVFTKILLIQAKTMLGEETVLPRDHTYYNVLILVVHTG